MKAFNAFQMVACFAFAPFGIGMLKNSEWHGPFTYVAGAAYVVGFVLMCIAVRTSLDDA